jgi:hypothetical protein
LQPTTYLLRCHCGALTGQYRTALEPAAWSIRACQCSFCLSHGVLSTSDPAGSLSFQCRDERLLQHYRFGLRLGDFLLCRECGVFVGAHMATAAGRLGIVNVRALQPQPPALAAPQPMDYSAEKAPAARQDRRQQRWTPITPDSL